MRYITPLSLVSEQNSFCRSPAIRRLDNDLRPLGAFEGEGSLSSPIRRLPGEQAQLSDLIAALKSYPTPESLLGLHPAKDTCRVDR
jgi:hypothetical protein